MDRTFTIEELLNEAGWLRRLATGLVGDGADDLVQDTWVAALRRPPEELAEPRPWLARVARNLARNARRDRTRRETRDELAHEERANPRPDSLVLEAEAQRVLAEAVTRLDEPLRAVVVLRYFQGVDSSAAAARLGIPASTVRTRLQKALEKLRADLDRRVDGGRASWMALFAPLVPRPQLAAASSGGGLLASWAPALIALASAAGVAAAIGATLSKSSQAERRSELVSSAGAIDERSATETVAAASISADAREAVEATDPAAAPQRSAVAARADTARVSGTILVDGAMPQWPLEITLEPDVPPASAELGGLRLRVHPERLTLAPERSGGFVFEGLRSDWSGRLIVRDYAFASGERALRIEAPIDGLVVELRSGPEIVGRIVEPTGAPAALLEGGYQLRTGVGDGAARQSERRRFACRADGRFRIACPGRGEWCELTLAVEDTARGYLLHSTPRFLAAAGHDAGELQLEALRSLAFTVRDPSGAPIEGALARVDGLSFRKLAPLTGADGTGVLELVPARTADVRFAAFGYADRTVRAEPGAALDIVLEPATVLDVRLRDAIAAHAVRVVVRAPRAAFVWDEGAWGDDATLQLDLGRTLLVARRSPAAPGELFEYEFEPVGDARIQLVGLVPDLLVSLEVFDSVGRSLGFDSVSLSHAQRLALELGDTHAPSEPPASGLRKRRGP